MRIAVMGAGAVGGYFGARLQAAGHDVAYVARGRHLDALRTSGLRILGPDGGVSLPSVVATDDPASLAPVDVVLFTVKLWDTMEAAARLAPLLRSGGVVLSLQNGVESVGMLSQRVPASQVLGGTAHIGAAIREPGVIEQVGTLARLRFGAVLGDTPPAGHAIAAAWREAGVDAEVVPDVERALWEKFAFLAALSGVTAICRQPVGVVRSDPDIRPVLRAAITEVWSLARARRISLPDDYVEVQMRLLDGLHPHMRSSLLHDLVLGNRLEAPWISGAVSRMGLESGVLTPVHATLYAAMKPYVAGVLSGA